MENNIAVTKDDIIVTALVKLSHIQCAHFLQEFCIRSYMKVYKIPAENEHTGHIFFVATSTDWWR